MKNIGCKVKSVIGLNGYIVKPQNRKTAIMLLSFLSLGTMAQSNDTEMVRHGIDLLEQDSLEAAEKTFSAAIQSSPTNKSNALLWRYIGGIQAQRGQDAEAI